MPDGALRTTLPVSEAGAVWGCAFSADGALLATASTDGTARLWRLSDAVESTVLKGHRSPVRTCAFSRTGRTL